MSNTRGKAGRAAAGRRERQLQAATQIDFRFILSLKYGKDFPRGRQLPACSICVLTKDMDAKTAVARVANTILRELSEVRWLLRKLVEEAEREREDS